MIMNRTEFNIVTIFFVLSVFYTESLLSDQAYIEDYLDAVFYAYWTEGKDISDDGVLQSIIEKLKVNPDAFFEYIGTQEVKEKLISNTQELMDRGGFGSPTFFIDETDMYFGNDRIQLIEEKL